WTRTSSSRRGSSSSPCHGVPGRRPGSRTAYPGSSANDGRGADRELDTAKRLPLVHQAEAITNAGNRCCRMTAMGHERKLADKLASFRFAPEAAVCRAHRSREARSVITGSNHPTLKTSLSLGGNEVAPPCNSHHRARAHPLQSDI